MPSAEPQIDLLYTKLHPPPVREKRVERRRLLHRLDAAAHQKLTLICAPAGYGKTTLLSQWIHQRPELVGWVSLDRSDNDLAQFLRYILAAIQQIDPAVGSLVPGMLQPPRPMPGPAVWITLINDIAASEKAFFLILDDYQEVEAGVVHEALDYLVEHLPDNLHLILSTRADPPINLPKLRARGQLLELRAADLCFAPEDAKSFFQEVMDLPISEAEVAGLVQKAEGWIAGLQIAAIVLQNQADLSQAVQSFTGSHRHILDYLAVEVIERLPGPTQEFLCQTALLDNLEASLCDAVTGRSDSQQILERLDRQNQFIIPLDNDQHWYRYHRLMAEALRRWSERLDGERMAALHHRASAWYAARGMLEAAVEHAFKANDRAYAADLIADSADAILKRSQVVTLLEWLERLPEKLIQERPKLNIAYAWALLLKGGAMQAVQARLAASPAHAPDASIAAEEAVIRAMLSNLTGNAAQGLAYSQRAMDDLPAERSSLRSIAADNLGIAHVLQGNIELAIRAFKESSALAREAGNIMFAVASLSNLGGLYIVQGHLKLADAVYRQALELATTPYGRLPVACRAMMGLAEIAREWNDLEQARGLLDAALQLSHQYGEIGELVMYLSLSRVRQSQGDAGQALDLIHKAQDLAIQSSGSPIDDRLVDASLARLRLLQDDIAGAVEWASKRGFEQVAPLAILLGDDALHLPYDLREAEWIVFARILLAQGRASAALETLGALLAEAQKQGRTRRLHEILVLTAVAYQETGAVDLAVDCLEKSLKLAEPEGYTRVYIDEGLPLAALLREVTRRGSQRQACSRLLSAFRQEELTQPHSFPAGQAELVEPLSAREVEVLQLLAEGCTNREISERLYISLSTVKGHTSSIFGKLLARNRTEAVARARQAGILPEA